MTTVWDWAKTEHAVIVQSTSLDDRCITCKCGWEIRGHWFDTTTAFIEHLKLNDTYCYGCDGGHVHRIDCSKHPANSLSLFAAYSPAPIVERTNGYSGGNQDSR